LPNDGSMKSGYIDPKSIDESKINIPGIECCHIGVLSVIIGFNF